MSFMTMQPGALTAAAGALQHIGSSMEIENAAAAAPTTGLVPAAADEVSALQATQFAAYGAWYQQVSARAAAIHQTLVNTLGTSAGSYQETEAANQAATGSTSVSGLVGQLTGSGTSSSGLSGALNSVTAAAADPPAVSSSTGATIGTPFNWFQNVGAASSDFIALGQGQFLPGAVSWDPTAPGAAGAPFMPTAPIAPATAADTASAPVLAGVGEASTLGGLSVPPSWASAGVPAASPAAAISAGAGWTGAAPQATQVTTMPAGVPSMASARYPGYGLGAPRYGIKPAVMPKPTVV